MSAGEQLAPGAAGPVQSLSRPATLWRRIWMGAGANAFGQLVTIGTQLLSLPLFLNYWSLQHYGAWLLISAVPAYFSLADVGVGTVAMNRMTMLVALGRPDDANRVFQSALALTLLSTLALFAVASIVIWSFDLGPVRDASTRTTASLLIAVALIGTFTPLIDGVFRATSRFASGTMYIHSVRLAEWAGGIAGLAMYRSMTAVAAGSLIGRVASTTLLTLWAARAFPQFRWRFREASRAQVRELLPSAAAFLALPIGNAMLFQGVTIAVGTGFGPAALALFNTCRTLSRIPVQLLTTFSRSLWPEMSRSFGAGDVASLGRIYHRSARVSIVVCALACAVLFAASPTILRYWSQGRLQADMPLIALLCIGSLAGCAWQIDQVLLSATNTHLRLSLWYFLSALLVVALVCIVPRQFGMDGVAILLIVFELAMLLVSRRMVGLPLRGAVA